MMSSKRNLVIIKNERVRGGGGGEAGESLFVVLVSVSWPGNSLAVVDSIPFYAPMMPAPARQRIKKSENRKIKKS